MVAAYNGYLEIVRLLLDNGADINTANKVTTATASTMM